MADASPGSATAPEAKRRSTPAANGAGPTGSGPVAGRDRPPAGATTGRGRGRPSKADKRAEITDRLTKRFVRWSLLLMFVDDRTAVAIVRHSPSIAESAADVAERYPWAAKFMDGAVKGGALIGLGGSLGMLGLEIAANKGLLPEPFGTFLRTPDADEEADARIAEAMAEQAAEQPAATGGPVDLTAGAGRLSDLLAGLR